MIQSQTNSVCAGTRRQKRKVLEREERAAGKAGASELNPAANHNVVSAKSVKASRRTNRDKPGTDDMIQPSVELSAEQVSGMSSTSASAHTTELRTDSMLPVRSIEADAVGIQSVLTPAVSKRRRLRKRNNAAPPEETEQEIVPSSPEVDQSSGELYSARTAVGPDSLFFDHPAQMRLSLMADEAQRRAPQLEKAIIQLWPLKTAKNLKEHGGKVRAVQQLYKDVEARFMDSDMNPRQKEACYKQRENCEKVALAVYTMAQKMADMHCAAGATVFCLEGLLEDAWELWEMHMKHFGACVFGDYADQGLTETKLPAPGLLRKTVGTKKAAAKSPTKSVMKKPGKSAPKRQPNHLRFE